MKPLFAIVFGAIALSTGPTFAGSIEDIIRNSVLPGPPPPSKSLLFPDIHRINPPRAAPIPVPGPTGSGGTRATSPALEGQLDANLERARALRRALSTIRGGEMICNALGALFAATPPANGCVGRVTNDKNTIIYQVSIVNDPGKNYEVEILGKSLELALGEAHWVERHRIYISLGFDAELNPNVTVSDFEPMLRTTPELQPIQDHLFEFIERKHDGLLRAFQDRIKNSILGALQVAMEKQRAEAK